MPTHGSMTKAGKVRKATPKIEPKHRKNLPPRLKNKAEFVRRVLKASSTNSTRRASIKAARATAS